MIAYGFVNVTFGKTVAIVEARVLLSSLVVKFPSVQNCPEGQQDIRRGCTFTLLTSSVGIRMFDEVAEMKPTLSKPVVHVPVEFDLVPMYFVG